MKQRMVMVISTLLNPSLLIADEITSALDVSSQKAVAQTLVEFRDRGFVDSMIVITHDVSILYQIADTLTVMYAGKLAEKAPTDVMMEAPLHPYTRLLISSLPEVGVRFEEQRLAGIPGAPPSLLNPPDGLPVPRSLPARRSRSAPRSRRSWRSRPATPSPAGRPPEMLTLDRVGKTYKVGALRRQGAARPSRTCRFDLARGRGRLAHRRERQRQVDDRPDDPAPARRQRRHDPRRRRGRLGAQGRRAARLLPPRPGRLPGPVQLVQPDLQGRPRLRACCATSTSATSPTTRGGDKVAASLATVNLEPGQVLHKFPHQLSGGQLQRLLIARALLLDTEYLVADEIISMLDASTRIDVLNLLGDLKARGLGILFITHDLSLGNYISERTVILRRGRIVEMGTTVAGLRQPAPPVHADAARLGPAPPRPVGHEGRGRGRVGRRRAGAAGGHMPLPRGPPRAARRGPAPTRSPILVEVESGHQVGCRRGEGEGPC